MIAEFGEPQRAETRRLNGREFFWQKHHPDPKIETVNE
jgi:hypothetical protein